MEPTITPQNINQTLGSALTHQHQGQTPVVSLGPGNQMIVAKPGTNIGGGNFSPQTASLLGANQVAGHSGLPSGQPMPLMQPQPQQAPFQQTPPQQAPFQQTPPQQAPFPQQQQFYQAPQQQPQPAQNLFSNLIAQDQPAFNPFETAPQQQPQVPQQTPQGAVPFDQYLNQVSIDPKDRAFVQTAYSQGLNPTQAQQVLNSQKEQVRQEEQGRIQKENAQIKQVESFLRGKWGQNFDQNVNLISQAIQKQVPNSGNQAEYAKAVKVELKKIFSSSNLAENALSLLTSQQQQPNLPGIQGSPFMPGQSPNLQPGQNQSYANDYQAWVKLMNTNNSPLYSNDPNARKFAMDQKALLEKRMFSHPGALDMLSPQKTGFFAGLV